MKTSEEPPVPQIEQSPHKEPPEEAPPLLARSPKSPPEIEKAYATIQEKPMTTREEPHPSNMESVPPPQLERRTQTLHLR